MTSSRRLAVVMTEAEAAHYANPNAVATLQRGPAEVEAGRVSKGKLRTKQAEWPPDG